MREFAVNEDMVVVVLTMKQAEAMQRAVEHATDYKDVMKKLFPDGRKRRSMYRAAEILYDAILEVS